MLAREGASLGSRVEHGVLAAFLPLLLATAGATLFVDFDAAWRNPFSDSIEYAVAAKRLATAGTYDVVLAGAVHPPRYVPGFSTLLVAPVYWLGADHYGAGILPVFLSGLVVVACIWQVCRRVLPGWAGVAAACFSVALLVEVPPFRRAAAQIMSDVPTLALFFGGLVLLERRFERPTAATFALAGILTAVAVSLRVTALSLCLPFVALLATRRSDSKLRDAVALFAPIALGVGALLLYQLRTFGDASFTGYDYWLLPEQTTLSLSHLSANLERMTQPFDPADGPVPWWHRVVGPAGLAATVALGFLCRLRTPDLFRRSAPIVAWLSLAAFPIVVFHLFYPFQMTRFALVLYAGVILLGSIWFFARVGEFHRSLSAMFAVISLLSILDSPLATPAPTGGHPLEVVRAAADVMGDDAVFISDLNGIYVHAMVIDGTRRTHLAASRAAPFTGWKDIGPPGAKPIRVFGPTALRSPDRIDALLVEGRRVFVHVPAQPDPASAWDRFRARFRLERVWRGHPEGPFIAEVVRPVG